MDLQVVLWFAATLTVRATAITMVTGEAKVFEQQKPRWRIRQTSYWHHCIFGIKRTNLSTGTYSHHNRSLQGGHGNFTVGHGMSLGTRRFEEEKHGERFASQLQKIEQKGLDRLALAKGTSQNSTTRRVMVPALNPRVTEK